mgnify:CR=1 FL=1
MKTLVIVESPSKCKKIEQYLGSGYKVIASFGHFTKLDSLDQISFDTFQIAYKVDKGKVLKTIKDEIKKCKEVILATDDDREGEAIAWALCVFCKLDLRKTKKMVFQEITKPALLRALDNLGHVNMDRVYSQQARQILDIYVGYKVSPMLWKYVQHTLSAGRCQTPALRLVYENQKEIDTLSQDTHFIVKAQFTDKKVPFSCVDPIEKTAIDSFMNQLCDKQDWKVETKKERQVKEKPPTILITSTLQQKAHSYLRMSPKQTMKYAQELYENGLITYMRTDSACYSKEFLGSLEKHIVTSYGNTYVSPQLETLLQNRNQKGKAQEAHEGIRVCDLEVTKSQVKTQAANTLYSFIYKHTIQCGMSDAIYHETTFGIPFQDTGFRHTDKQCTFQGWRIVDAPKPFVSFVSYLSTLFASKTPFGLPYAEANESLIHQKSHYHEASLIQKLESLSIGRPSTYSSILSSIIDKKYVIKGNIEGCKVDTDQYVFNRDKGLVKEIVSKVLRQEKQKLVISALGKQVCEFCYTHFNELFQYSFTSLMEQSLDHIEHQEKEQKTVLSSFIQTVDTLVQATTSNYESHPEHIKKVKDQSIHCGQYKGCALYIKNGQHGYYACFGKKDKISLKEFQGFCIETAILRGECHDVDKQSLITFIENRKNVRKENMCVVLSQCCSIRKSKYGYYVYYQTKKMKKPTFYKYNDEKDEQSEERMQWIVDENKKEIISYLMKKYNMTI